MKYLINILLLEKNCFKKDVVMLINELNTWLEKNGVLALCKENLETKISLHNKKSRGLNAKKCLDLRNINIQFKNIILYKNYENEIINNYTIQITLIGLDREDDELLKYKATFDMQKNLLSDSLQV